MIEKIITGIVLEKIPFEDEHIVKILTKGGNLISIRAKGLNKLTSKNRFSLRDFNICEIEYFTSGRTSTGRLKRAKMIKEFSINDEWVLNIVNLIKEIVSKTKNNSNLIYEIINVILNKIEKNIYSFQDILSLLIVSLRNEGYNFVVDKCVKCGSFKKIKGFSLYEGGLICEKHEIANKYELDFNLLKKIIELNLIRNPLEAKDLNFSLEDIQKLKSMYKMFFENQLGINLFLITKI